MSEKTKSSIQKNDIITLKINEINNLGCGVGKTDDGIVVFVNGAATGDIIKAKIIKIAKTFLVGRLEQIIEKSPYRSPEEFCTAPLSCGGCVYRHVTYEHELALKKNYVQQAFIKAGLTNVAVKDVLTATDCHSYRNKAQYPVGKNNSGHITAGFYASKTHNIVSSESCSLQPEEFSNILHSVCELSDKLGYTVYDEKSGTGLLRHFYLREAKGTGEIMLCLVVNGQKLPHTDKFVREISSKHPKIKSIMLNINTKSTNVVLGDKYLCLFGLTYITDILCGKKFQISAGSFYQVNHDGAELLYSTAMRLADLTGNETLLDLYCGIGTIGLSMSDKVEKIVGIEIVQEAVECAKKNAALNKVENAYYFCGDASSAKKLFSNALGELDISRTVAILDPPRKGSTPELIDYLASLGIRKIVYISCDPDTLARDCAHFSTLGYTIGDVTPVDMFARTGHVECVTLLSLPTKI